MRPAGSHNSGLAQWRLLTLPRISPIDFLEFCIWRYSSPSKGNNPFSRRAEKNDKPKHLGMFLCCCCYGIRTLENRRGACPGHVFLLVSGPPILTCLCWAGQLCGDLMPRPLPIFTPVGWFVQRYPAGLYILSSTLFLLCPQFSTRMLPALAPGRKESYEKWGWSRAPHHPPVDLTHVWHLRSPWEGWPMQWVEKSHEKTKTSKNIFLTASWINNTSW